MRRRPLDGVLLLLGFFLLLVVAARLEATQWASGLGLVSQAVLLAYLLGALAGGTRWRGAFVALLALAYGVTLLPLLLINLTSRFAPLAERLISLAVRLRWAWEAFAADRPVGDVALFLALLIVVAWVMGWWVGFVVARRRALWAALLPPLAALWVIQAYDPLVPTRAAYLLIFSALVLLYLAWYTFGARRAAWQRQRLLVPLDLGWDWMRVALGAAVLVGTLAWHLPRWEARVPGLKEAWEQATQPWVRIQHRLSRLVGPLQGTTVWEAPGYVERLALGTGVPQTDTLIFEVQAPRASLGERYYWRVQTFVAYRQGFWEVRSAKVYAPDETTFPQPGVPVVDLALRFVLAQPAEVLATGLYPRQVVGLPYRIYALPVSKGVGDPLAFVAKAPLPPGTAYRVREWKVHLTAEVLRQAGTDYPRWVQPYLQVPEDVPQRVRALAAALAQQAANPYDRARSVTAYLRRRMTYRNPLPAPPPKGRDPVDWFLFEAQEGFCTYYASAEVVLLRLMGIPARLAVGYAQGRYADGVYRVRARDSHAWPEVFFPGVGWVPFEPTVSRPALVRPGDVPPGAAEEASEDLLSPQELVRLRRQELTVGQGGSETPQGGEEHTLPAAAEGRTAALLWWPWLRLMGGALLGLAAVVALGWAVQQPWLPRGLLAVGRRLGVGEPRGVQRWLRWAALSEVDRAFWEMGLWLRALGGALPPGAGPQERAGALIQRLPASRRDVELVMQAYVRLHFAPPEKRVVALAPVRLARRRLRRATWRALWRRLGRRARQWRIWRGNKAT